MSVVIGTLIYFEVPNKDIDLILQKFLNETFKLIITSEIFIILQLKVSANQVNSIWEVLKINHAFIYYTIIKFSLILNG